MAQHKKDGSCQRLVVTGCLAERYRDELRARSRKSTRCSARAKCRRSSRRSGARHAQSSPLTSSSEGASLATNAPAAASFIAAHRSRQHARRHFGRQSPTYIYDANTPRIFATPRHYAYVKVAEGCDYKCAFCIIPKLRGAYRSRTTESIVEEARGARRTRREGTAPDLAGHDLLRHRPRRARRPRAAAPAIERGRGPRVDPAALPLPHDDRRRRRSRRWRSARRSAATSTCRFSTPRTRAEADEAPGHARRNTTSCSTVSASASQASRSGRLSSSVSWARPRRTSLSWPVHHRA